jgi:Leucine-rich repeat (LRR) protein
MDEQYIKEFSDNMKRYKNYARIPEKSKIYKNDLKFSENFDFETTEFESDTVKNLYNFHKNKPKIEIRIIDSEMENYEYLDLSKLDLNDKLLSKLLTVDKIKYILSKIKYLDLSTNNLTKYPDLSKYTNIIYLSISKNQIEENINDNNLIELTCDFNKISRINSHSITKLSANNNELVEITIPNIKVLHINNNKVKIMGDYFYLEYLECINNEIKNIQNLFKLQEIYIGSNKLEKISNLPNLLILNCVDNPIKKIIYFENVKLILSSTPNISSKYKIENITKIKNDYLINMQKN